MSTPSASPPKWSSTAGWREFLDLLGDPVVVVDPRARVLLANTAALRLLPCEAGTPIEHWRGVLGDAAVQWLAQAALQRGDAGTPPDGRLPDGRHVKLSWRRLDPQHAALHLTLVAAGPPSALRPPSAPNRPLPGSASPPSSALTSPPRGDLFAFVWDSPFPAVLQGPDLRIADVNQAFVDFLGFTPAQVIGCDPIDLLPPEDQPAALSFRARLHANLEQEMHTMSEGRLLDAGGHECHYRVARRTPLDIGGQVHYLAVLQNTTAERVARDHADRSMRELDDWFDLSPAGMVLFDDRGLFVRTNPAFDALAGAVPVAMSDAPASLRELLGWDDSASVAGQPALPPLEPGAPPVQRQGWVVASPNSAPRPMRAILRCYRTVGGQRRTMAVVEDRSAEEERDLAQMQVGALVDTAGVALATFQESSGWVRQTPVAGGGAEPKGINLGDTGASGTKPMLSGLQGIGREVVLPESRAEFERLQAALRDAEHAEVRYAILHPDLGRRWLLTRVEPATLASGQRTTAVVTLDITDQHLAQLRNDELLRELSTILESTSAGIAYLRDNVLVRCNRRFEAMLGLGIGGSGNADALAGRPLHELLGGDERAERIVADAWQALSEGVLYETEFDVAVQNPRGTGGTADSGRRWYSLSVRRAGAERGPNDAVESIAALSDVTRLKAQQQEFEILARDRELMFSLSEVGIAFLRGGLIQRANEALAQLSGYSVAELSTLALPALFVDADAFSDLWPQTDRRLREDGRWTGERHLRRRDGRIVRVQVSKRLVSPGDRSGGIIASYVNVDARWRAERAVALQAERTRSILDSVLVGIVTVGPRGIEWMNRSASRMFSADLADLVDRPIESVATPEPDHPFRRIEYLTELVEGAAETFECRVQARDGRRFWVVGNVVSTARESDGRQLTYALLDIERRREAEARMSQAQTQLQRIIEAAPLAITLRDARTLKVLQVNEVAARSAHATPAALIGRTPEQLFDPATAAQHRSDMAEALASAEVTTREYRTERDGESRVWDARYLPLSEGPGKAPDQLLLVATDVTEQRLAAEARFDAAIAQREMLVKEVHHRIKNNLQGVAGLLQQIGQRKPEVAGPISEVVSQVQAIAHVYGLQVGESGPLQLESVVKAITASVQRTFGCTIGVASTGLAPSQWLLPEAESIPIALTLNELLTNAVKHHTARRDGATSASGLPSESAGAEVRCVLASSESGVRVSITNLGSLPPDFNLAGIRGSVSGLGLVRALLPRRSAEFMLVQQADEVVATVVLQPPGVMRAVPG